MQPAGAEAVIAPSDHVVAPDYRGVVAKAFCHQLRERDRVSVMADHTRDEDRAGGQRDMLSEVPYVPVARVCRFHGGDLDLDVQPQVDDLLQRDVRVMRPLMCAPADVPASPAVLGSRG